MIPRVELWYAAKALDDDEVFKQIIKNGCGFDVASNTEFNKVIKLGAKPEQLIFANPVKEEFQLEQAKARKIKKMTFDCVEELHKIKKYYPEAECVIRIATDETNALYNLNEKFGVHISKVPEIL